MEELFVHLFARDARTGDESAAHSRGSLEDDGNCEHLTRVVDGNGDFSVQSLLDLMATMVRQCSLDAIAHLDAGDESRHAPAHNVSVRILAMLQVHLLGITASFLSKFASSGDLSSNSVGHQHTATDLVCSCVVDTLLLYMDALITEAMAVLKKLHKSSCHHEEVVAWRLNGSFFQLLLPNAIETLCVLVPLAASTTLSGNSQVGSAARPKWHLGLRFAHQLLPHLLPMIKMLDEVNWKMRDTMEANNQARHEMNDCSFQERAAENHSWVIELEDACGILCGKLACVLASQSSDLRSANGDGHSHSTLSVDGYSLPTAPTDSSATQNIPELTSILRWERDGVFETEDEIESSEDMKPDGSRENNADSLGDSLFRIGLCFFHDLLRKLTISSTKCFLLEELVSAIKSKSELQHSKQRHLVHVTSDSPVTLKPIENLYIRLAKIISAEESSVNLKEKALMAWTIPLMQLGASSEAAADVVAKSGIVSIVADTLEGDFGVIETHSSFNSGDVTNDHSQGLSSSIHITSPPNEKASAAVRAFQNIKPVASLLYVRTAPQALSHIAWAALCAIAVQLNESSVSAIRAISPLLARAATPSVSRGSSSKEVRSARSAMSPRKRLTLPKRNVVSTVQDSSDRTYELLFLLLSKAKGELELEGRSAQRLTTVLSRVATTSQRDAADTTSTSKGQVSLLGTPTPVSSLTKQAVKFAKHPSAPEARLEAFSTDSNSSLALTVCSWIYIEQTGAVSTGQLIEHRAAQAHFTAAEAMAELPVIFSLGNGSPVEAVDPETSRALALPGAELLVFATKIEATQVTLAIALRREGEFASMSTWETIILADETPAGRWIHFAFVTDGSERRVFLDGKRATCRVGEASSDLPAAFASKRLSFKPLLWVGGALQEQEVSLVMPNGWRSNGVASPKATSVKKHDLAGVVDDVLVLNTSLTDQDVAWIAVRGPVLFQLKRQDVIKTHCGDILQLLCQLHCFSDSIATRSTHDTSSALSGRWTTLFIELLDIVQLDGSTQVYLRDLLAETLPQIPPSLHSGISLSSLCRSLFKGLEDRRSPTDDASISCSTALIFAGGVRLIQSLWRSPFWKEEVEALAMESASEEGDLLTTHSVHSADNKPDVWQLAALCYALGGYSELAVNECTARRSEQSLIGAFAPTRMEAPYSSHMATRDTRGDSTASVPSPDLVFRLARKLLASVFEMPPRGSSPAEDGRALDLLATDERVALMTHLRASVLRFLATDSLGSGTTSLLWTREGPGDENRLQQQQEPIGLILTLASSAATEVVMAALGPDYKRAIRVRSVRGLLERLVSTPSRVSSTLSIPQLEELAWNLWTSSSKCKRSVNETCWWQENRSERQSVLEILGGEVEICHLTVKALEHFPTVRLSNVAIAADTGLWFYEVTVLSDGLMQIGYVDSDFDADPVQGQGVGDHTNSWGFDGYRCKKWNVNSSEYGVAWSADDVVGVLLDTDRMELSYFLNGKFLGVAFSGLPMTASSRMCPAASLNVHQAALFNFGSPDSELLGFAHAPVLDSEQDQCRFQPVAAAMALVLKDGAKHQTGDEAEGAIGFSIHDMLLHGGEGEGTDIAQSNSDDGDDTDAKGVAELAEMLPGVSFLDTFARDNRLDFLSSLQVRRQEASGDTSTLRVDDRVKVGKTMQSGQQLPSHHDEAVVDDDLAMELSLSWNVYNSSGLGDVREAVLLPSIKNTTTGSQDPAVAQDLTASEAVLRCITLDNVLAVVYARHTLCHILTSATYTEEALNLVSRWCVQPDSTRRLLQFIRVALGVGGQEIMAELQHAAGALNTLRRSLQMLESLRTLLKLEFARSYERSDALADSEHARSATQRLPIFHALFSELKNQCMQLLALDQDRKRSREDAWTCGFWVVWLAEVILTSVDEQFRQLSLAGRSEFELVVTSTCFSLPFFQTLIDLASIGSTPAKLAAFTLMKCVLSGVASANRKDMPPAQMDIGTEWKTASLEALVGAMGLQRTLELFAKRSRKENVSRVFCSSVTAAMFELLAWHWETIRCDHRDAAPSRLGSERDGGVIELHIESFSPTHATVSWSQKLEPNDPSPDSVSTSDAAAESTVLSLSVYRQPNVFQADADSTAIRGHVLPSKGAYTVRNLCPDTRYVFHLSHLETIATPAPLVSHETLDSVVENSEPSSQASEQLPPPEVSSCTEQPTALSKSCALVLQTPPEPVFQLDGDSMGKNLMLFNRNLSVKNLVNKKWHTVRASVGFDEGVHQWHVRIDTCVSKNVFIGVCTLQASLDNYIGSDGYGYGFLANKAVWHNKSKVHSYGEIFKQGDLLHVTLDCNAKTLAFSRNGEYLGIAATNLHAAGGGGSSYASSLSAGEACKWYPAFSLYNKDDQLTITPPSAASSMYAHSVDRPQNASVLDLLEAMEHVKAYETLGDANPTSLASRERLYAAAYVDFTAWSARELLFREADLGRLVRIDASSAATHRFGFSNGDAVFTARGQATVLGVHNHELWYECDNNDLNDAPVLGTWNLHVCKQMLTSPSEFPVHRSIHGLHKSDHRHHQADLSDRDEQSEPATRHEVPGHETLTYEAFERAQERWNGMQAYKDLDVVLVEILNEIASSRAMRNPQWLSFSDVSAELVLGETTAPLLEQLRATLNESCERETRPLLLARIGLLLFVNRSLYATTRLTVAEPARAALFPQSLSTASASLKKSASDDNVDDDDDESESESATDRKKQLADASSAVATDFLATLASAMASSRFGRSCVDGTNTLPARMLFKAQKAKFVAELLQRTTTPTLNSPARDLQTEFATSSAFDDTYDPSDLPRVCIRYPVSRCTPFWRPSTVSRKRLFVMAKRSRSESLFAQVSKQLENMSPRDWRRAYSTPFEPLPTTRAFHVTITAPVEPVTGDGVGSKNKTLHLGKAKANAVDMLDGVKMPYGEGLETELEGSVQQPPSPSAPVTATVGTQPFPHHLQSQATQYARLLEELLNEVQSPVFPLFVPVAGGNLVLDVNTALLAPGVIAQSSLAPAQVLRWFFQLGQIFGLAWRGNVLLPLQFVSSAFWTDLVDDVMLSPLETAADLVRSGAQGCVVQDGESRLAILEAIREGIFSVIPSRCFSLLTPLDVKSRLSDPNDVFAIETLQRHAEFDSKLRHHAMFWELVGSFTAVERRALLLFLSSTSSSSSASRRDRSSESVESPPFVLEISGDALADSQSHPDACYPVVVAVSALRSRLHLPAYSSLDAMRKKLTLAMTAGSTNYSI